MPAHPQTTDTKWIGAVPKFVPRCQFPAPIHSVAGQPTRLLSDSYRLFFGAGRGNRTPMELLPTDFEFIAHLDPII
jgi:hypothetical protein